MAVELDYMEYANDGAAQTAYVTDADYSLDLCTSGTPSADSEYGAGYEASLAFDNLYTGNANYWQTANVVFPHWLKYDFGAGNAKTITRYTIRAYDESARIYDIKDWTFEGSNNDSDWDNLDTKSSVTWTRAEYKIFDIANSTAYRYYRLYITLNQQPNNYGLIQEVEMMETALQSYSEDTIKEQGTYSLKGIASITSSLNDTLTRTVDPTIDLTDLTQIKFDIRASRTGINIRVDIHDSGGTTTGDTINIVSANTWQTETWDMSGTANDRKDTIDSIFITIINADAKNTFYIDNMYAEIPSVGITWNGVVITKWNGVTITKLNTQ